VINAKDQIKDTIVGTIASILSNSSVYPRGTVIIAMAYYDDKVKVSARVSGRNQSNNVGKERKNVREILNSIIQEIGGEVGGHEFAAGCIITKSKEKSFIEAIKKSFEVELVKI